MSLIHDTLYTEIDMGYTDIDVDMYFPKNLKVHLNF